MKYAITHKNIVLIIFTMMLSLASNVGYACHGSGIQSATATYDGSANQTFIEIEFCLGVTDLFGVPSDFQFEFSGAPDAPILSAASSSLSVDYNFNQDAFAQTFFCNCDDSTVGTPPTILPNTDTWTATVNGTTINYMVSRSDNRLTQECQIDCVDEAPTGISGGDVSYITDISACYVITVIFDGDVSETIGNVVMSGAESGVCDEESSMTFDFSGGGALAVELSQFDTETRANSTVVNWTTTTENDVYKYVIERSNNGVTQFEALGNVAVSGNSQTTKSYAFEDMAPIAKGYYRLKTVDIDGSISYSGVVLVEREVADMRMVNVYPNPVEGTTEIIYETKANSNVHFKVFDVNGTLKGDQVIDAANGFNRIPFDFSELREGIYFIVLESGKEKIVKRVTKF